jgi:hypothetical protein
VTNFFILIRSNPICNLVTANLPPIRLNQIAQPLEQLQTATTTAASNPFASPLQPQRLNFLSPRAGQVNSFYNSNYNAYEDTTPSAPSVSINSFLDASSGSNSLRQRTFSQKGMKSMLYFFLRKYCGLH